MLDSRSEEDLLHARRLYRLHSRQLMHDRQDVQTHIHRLKASLDLAGSEPAQGALADMFTSIGELGQNQKEVALGMVRSRLAPHIARWFATLTMRRALPSTNALATRWSVIARPTTDISTRARRCSVDDSRRIAAQAILDIERGDIAAQEEFLHHCITCHDNLAFMLARRSLLKTVADLPPEWETVSLQLEQASA